MTQEDVEIFAKGIPLKTLLVNPLDWRFFPPDAEKNQSQIPCNYCRRKVSSGQAYGGLLWQSGGLATIDYGNFSIR